jgi:hypothetical protein
MAHHPQVGQVLLIIEGSRSNSHTQTHTTLGSDQPVAETPTWQHTTFKSDIHAPDGIRTRNPSMRAVADPRLRPRDQWDRLKPHNLPTNISLSMRNLFP